MVETSLVATAIPIHQIHPDPNQPRRWLPSDLSEALAAGANPAETLSQLRERKRDKWVQERLEELDALADSIAADGLMQPIRVIQESDNSYRIETGERRWWAHKFYSVAGMPALRRLQLSLWIREQQHRECSVDVLPRTCTVLDLPRWNSLGR